MNPLPSRGSGPAVRPRTDYADIANGRLDEGDLTLVMAHVAQLPPADLALLAEGPVMDREIDCRVCEVLKDEGYPNEPEDPQRRAGWWLVQWHNATLVQWHNETLAVMYERCLVIYLAARLRIAEEAYAAATEQG